MKTNDVNQVRDLFQQFQDSYTARDPKNLDAVMELFVQSDDLEIVGTGAVGVGTGEWCMGIQATRELVESDWEYWGDVVYDVLGARIHVRGNVAWLATTGTVTDVILNQERYTGYMDYVQSVVEEDDDAKEKMLDILLLGNEVLAGILKGETCTWPFRFTAVAVRDEGQWRFHQMQFSFPTTRAPDVQYN
ncbi:MAG: hypothetical protein GY832_26770 [Chloroflexi bacterium]|nr:hypothetical protein [Chloroflexota bacterium]